MREQIGEPGDLGVGFDRCSCWASGWRRRRRSRSAARPAKRCRSRATFQRARARGQRRQHRRQRRAAQRTPNHSPQIHATTPASRRFTLAFVSANSDMKMAMSSVSPWLPPRVKNIGSRAPARTCGAGAAGRNLAAMVETVISIRNARLGDEAGIARVHDEAWREAYRGVIPGRELERMIIRRGPAWWRRAISRGHAADRPRLRRGRRRLRQLWAQSHALARFRRRDFRALCRARISGAGLGRRMFEAAQRDLSAHGYASFVVWALAGNDRGLEFYRRLGGRDRAARARAIRRRDARTHRLRL